jgi:hypothetical protein
MVKNAHPARHATDHFAIGRMPDSLGRNAIAGAAKYARNGG